MLWNWEGEFCILANFVLYLKQISATVTTTFLWRESYIVASQKKVYLINALINQYLDNLKKLEHIRIYQQKLNQLLFK